jgi:hypothetical protein
MLLDYVWNVMAHAQKADFVFRRKGGVHLNRLGRQFSRLLAVEVCASTVVMLDTTCSEVVWRVLATHSIRHFPFIFPPVRHHVPSHFNWTLPYNVRRVTSNSQICEIWVSVKESSLVECDAVSLDEWLSTLRRRDFPSEPWPTTQQLTLRHFLEDVHLKPSDLFKHLAEKVGSRETFLIFVMGVSGSNSHLSIYSPNWVNGRFLEYLNANFGY